MLLRKDIPELSEQLSASMTQYLFRDQFSSEEVKGAFSNALSEVWELEVMQPCPCSNDFCGSFYTRERTNAEEARLQAIPSYTFPLEGDNLIITVVGGHLVYVEVLFRPEIKAKVDAIFRRTDA
jgi:hypothetical protein